MKLITASIKLRTRFSIFFCGLLILGMTACTSPSSPEMLVDVPEKPVVITVGMTPALAQYEDVLQGCAADVSVLVDVLPWIRLQDTKKDVFIVYGEGDKPMGENVYQIGESPLVFIVHPDLPVNSLTLAQVQGIFNGAMTDWVEYAITSSYMGEIQPWGMMEETEIMQYMLNAIELKNPTGQWSVAPTPADIVTMVSLDQNAIGVVPAYALTDDLKVLIINGVEFDSIPVLAMWDHEPNDAEQEWLLCVQESMK